MSAAITAAVVGGAGAYLASRNTPKVPKPTKADYGGQVGNLLGVYKSTLPDVMSMEGSYRPGLMGLNLGDMSTALYGDGDYAGYIEQAGKAQQQAQGQIEAARAAEIGGMTGQAGAVRGLLGALSPESQRMMQLQQQAAERAYESSQGLTDQEARVAQQVARESSMASGRIGGTGAVAAELLNREDALSRKRAEAAQAGNQAYQTAQNYYGQGLNLLSQTPAGVELGSKYAATGAGMIGSATPQLFDYNTAFNMEQQRMGSQDQYQQAKYAQKMQNVQNNMAMWNTLGGIGSKFASMPGGGGGGGYMQGIGNNSMQAAQASGAY